MKFFRLVIAGVCLALGHTSFSATRTCADASYAEVNNAVNGTQSAGHTTWSTAAADGDIVVIPAAGASPVHWANQLVIAHNIVLQGATIVIGDHTSVDAHHESTMSLNATASQTKIIDDTTSSTAAGSIIHFTTLNNDSKPRLTGLTISPGTGPKNTNGKICIDGASKSFRMDNCYFGSLPGYGIVFKGAVEGVMDHCIQETSENGIVVRHDTWGGGTNGDGSWTDATQLGTSHAIYVEDCTFNNLSTSTTNANLDGWSGMRRVTRYCLFRNARPGNHGTESGGRQRGAKTREDYNNVIVYETNIVGVGANFGEMRGGVFVAHDNDYYKYDSSWNPVVGSNNYVNLNIHRAGSSYLAWGGATGDDPLDKNDNTTDSSGNGVGGGTGGLYASGVTTGASTIVTGSTVVPTDHTWTVNQWAAPGDGSVYAIANTDTINPTLAAAIVSNTANTITTQVFSGTGTQITFANGAHYAIRKVYAYLDAPGRGAGKLLTGNPATLSDPSPCGDGSTGACEPLEGCYAWNNTFNGTSSFAVLHSATDALVSGTDFVNNSSPVGYTPLTYPHPLVAPNTGKIIVLSGDMDFGNVIAGDTLDRTLTITNTGDDTLTVTNVADDNDTFSVDWTDGTISAGSSQDVTVTFAPDTEQSESGTITVTSDATGGTNTIATTGRGVAGENNDRPYSVFRVIRKILSRWLP